MLPLIDYLKKLTPPLSSLVLVNSKQNSHIYCHIHWQDEEYPCWDLYIVYNIFMLTKCRDKESTKNGILVQFPYYLGLVYNI